MKTNVVIMTQNINIISIGSEEINQKLRGEGRVHVGADGSDETLWGLATANENHLAQHYVPVWKQTTCNGSLVQESKDLVPLP